MCFARTVLTVTVTHVYTQWAVVERAGRRWRVSLRTGHLVTLAQSADPKVIALPCVHPEDMERLRSFPSTPRLLQSRKGHAA